MTSVLAMVAAPAILLSACGGGASEAGEEAEEVALAEACPTTVADMRGSTEPFVCSCAPEDADRGVIFGTNPYLDDSGVCVSAKHAGLLNDGPANIEITFSDGLDDEFEGSEANGETSAPYISSNPPRGAITLAAAD